jgi:hypothetical protein
MKVGDVLRMRSSRISVRYEKFTPGVWYRVCQEPHAFGRDAVWLFGNSGKMHCVLRGNVSCSFLERDAVWEEQLATAEDCLNALIN